MTFALLGICISVVKATNFTRYGCWTLLNGEELFLPVLRIE
jgi:hypothetical protein